MDNATAKSGLLDRAKAFFNKLASVNKIKTIALVAVLAVIGVLCLKYKPATSNKSTSDSVAAGGYYVSSIDYCNTLEQKLASVLSNIEGVGNVKVMVTLSSSLELVLANSTELKSNSSNGSTINNSYTVDVSTPILIDSDTGETPLVVKEILPKISGVLVVCKGADNVKTKLDIVQAIKSLTNINSSNIQVLSGK